MPMKKVYVYLPFGNFDQEIAKIKRKGARYDGLTKTWYFSIEVGESLNESCRGYKIKKIENPPTFEEVLTKKNIVLQKCNDPFDDQSDDDNINIQPIIVKQNKQVIDETICEAFNIDTERFSCLVETFLNEFRIKQINQDRFTLYYSQLVESKRFYKTSTWYPSYDQAKMKGFMKIAEILEQLNDFDEQQLAKIQSIKNQIQTSVGIAFSKGEPITDLNYGCQGYDRNIIHNLDTLKHGLTRFFANI